VIDTLIISLIFGIICLDQRYVLQLNISQPLFTATLMGILTGHFEEAVYFGALVQLLWLSNLPVGASVIPDGNLASVIGVALFIKYSKLFADHGHFLLLVVILYVIIWSYVAGQIDIFARKQNERIMDSALQALRREDKKVRLGPYISRALAQHLALNVLLIFTGIATGSWLMETLYLHVPAVIAGHWRFVEIALAGTGIGMMLGLYNRPKSYLVMSIISIFILGYRLWIM